MIVIITIILTVILTMDLFPAFLPGTFHRHASDNTTNRDNGSRRSQIVNAWVLITQ